MLRTENQRKTLCTGCPLARTIDLVGDTQTLLIAKSLMTGSKRFGEISQYLQGVSTRTISNKLRHMLENELVEKIESGKDADSYMLTKKGKGLKKILDAMKIFGERHV